MFFFSFYYPKCTYGSSEGERERERERESWRQPRCTYRHRGDIQSFSEPLLRSAFMSFVQGYLKALNHLSFSAFVSLIQLRLFSTFQPWAVWRKASTQSRIMSNSSSGLFFLPGSKSSLVYIIFWTPMQSSCSVLQLIRLLTCHSCNFLWSLLQYLRLVYFGKQVYFQ